MAAANVVTVASVIVDVVLYPTVKKVRLLNTLSWWWWWCVCVCVWGGGGGQIDNGGQVIVVIVAIVED